MAFTNGYLTWIIGEGGLISRTSAVRFPWESNPDKLPATDGKITTPVGSCTVPTSDPNGPVTVAGKVFPDPKSFLSRELCLTTTPDISTDRLYAYISQHPGISLCRCQNIPASQSIYGHPSETGWIATVRHYWPIFGNPENGAFDVFIVQSSRGWLIDDIRCTGGGPETSVYAGSTSRCKQAY